jgi:hypothetical protein
MKSQRKFSALLLGIGLIYCLVALNSHSLSAQTISYMIPDIGTPDLNTYVEFIGPYNQEGNFGQDGFYLNSERDLVRIQPAVPGDTNKITIGPFVVSWNGKMISAQIFVHPDVTPNSDNWASLDPEFIIPIQIDVNGGMTNVVQFYIVRSQSAIVMNGGGVLGAGAGSGFRSRRGAMIVDSISFGDGSYTVFNGDPDQIDAGNQGYLPLTIISKGRITASASATLSVSGAGLDGGVGGAGGGGAFCDVTGDGSRGGSGFTGGGRGGRNSSGVPFISDIFQAPGIGTGPELNNTGSSLNGLPGGTGPWYEASGGGGGHPFGLSGDGCNSGSGCNPPGGYGGGSGYRQDEDGGGGGYATPGASSSGINGGQVHGNAALVPLAGGSGGAGGNPQGISQCSGEGGGGGGGIRIFGSSISNLQITANGGDGQLFSEASGGGGSGGAVIAESKLMTAPQSISAAGGGGGRPGGAGRLRIDGPRGTVQQNPVDASFYRGVSTDTSHFVARNFTLTGTGDGNDIHLYLKPENEPWQFVAVITGYSANAWSYNLTLPGTQTLYYLCALQEISNPETDTYTAEPTFVFGQAAANILRYRPVPIIAADTVVQFSSLLCDDSALDTIYVRNEGDADLILSNAQFSTGASTILEPALPAIVAPNDSIRVIIRLDASTGPGVYSTFLILDNNDTAAARNPYFIRIAAVKEEASFDIAAPVLALGDISCLGFIDTVITIINTGTVDIDIMLPGISNAVVSVLDPPIGSFPISVPVAAGGMREIRIRIQPTSTGPDSSRVSISSTNEYCDVTWDAFISWEWEDISYDITDIPEFNRLFCVGDFADTTFTISNTGSSPLTFENLGISNGSFSVISPSFPLTLQPGESQVVTIRFTGLAPGTAAGTFDINVLPCNTIESKSLRGLTESIQLTANDLNFGVRMPIDLPMTMFITVQNQSTVSIDVTNLLFPQSSPFRVVGGIPTTIPPGGSAQVEVEFFDPGMDSTFVMQAEFEYNPSCDPLYVNISAVRGEASVTIEVGSVSAATGETVSIPIYLRSAINLSLHGATGISTTIRMDPSILYPVGATPAGTITNGERIITLTLPLTTGPDEIATRLDFISMLGTTDRTDIIPENSVGLNGDITITEIPGEFTLSDVCREGGDRFFDGSLSAQLAQNTPNPFNSSTRIEYSVIEQGPVLLYVFDRLGRNVRTLVNTEHAPGTYSVVFDAGDLPSGIYRYTLQTTTLMKVKTMIHLK